MDQAHSITLLAALQRVPDPRNRRGCSFEWSYLLAIVAAALMSGCTTGTAITTWAHDHAVQIIDTLKPESGRIPSDATLRRTVRSLDILALEQAVALFSQALDERDVAAGRLTGLQGQTWRAQAIDGKDVRGARAHGRPTHLVNLVRHGTGYTLGQTAVSEKSNEITAVPHLLATRLLRGTVTTMDALLTQRHLARQIIRQQGHYFMVVKRNQPEMYASLDTLFRQPPVPVQPGDFARVTTVDKAHGRLEQRDVTCSTALHGYLNWPGAAQVVQRRSRCVHLKTGVVTTDTSYAVTSLPPHDAGPEQLAHLWRGHWTIENRVFHVRDVTMAEDPCQVHAGESARALAALRGGILSLLRFHRWHSVAAAFRHYHQRPVEALRLISHGTT